MANKVVFKMFSIISLFVLVSSVQFSQAVVEKGEKCNCYNMCNKNFTTNSVHDAQRITACQRGCRFFSLVLHTSHSSQDETLRIAREGCILSCSESYINPADMAACEFGCSTVDMSIILCNKIEIQSPQLSYSFLVEESDILIHPGEPEPDDSLTDPGLRKQIQKTLAALFDGAPKIPEIRFRDLPLKREKLSEFSHTTFKCPKFYGLDSKFEFRNGKIIIGDLYLFVGVFIFVVLCFLLGHHIETKNIKRQLMESRFFKKDDFDGNEPMIRLDVQEKYVYNNQKVPENFKGESEVLDSTEIASGHFDTKFEGITLVFHEKDLTRDTVPEANISLKI